MYQHEVQIAVTLEGNELRCESLDPKSSIKVDAKGNISVPRGRASITFVRSERNPALTFRHFGVVQEEREVFRSTVEAHQIHIEDSNEVAGTYKYELSVQPSPEDPVIVIIEPVVENESGGGGVDEDIDGGGDDLGS